jgi:hypothetical protein
LDTVTISNRSLQLTSPMRGHVVGEFGLKGVIDDESLVVKLLRNSGKLLVYASTGGSQRKRLDSVREAAEATAQRLNLGFEVVPFRKRCSQIYVYYENGSDEPVPIYCDEGKSFDLEGICANLRRMMFVLSFHPRNGALRMMRSELMGFS